MEAMNPANIRYLIIHCSATRDTQDYSVDRLERDHQRRGFETVGYHYYIRRNGAIHALRKHHEVGAHCRGFNRCSLGICYEGGVDQHNRPRDTRTVEQKWALEHLLLMLTSLYPEARIVGHRDLSPDLDGDGKIMPREWIKACPSFEAGAEYRHIRQGKGGVL